MKLNNILLNNIGLKSLALLLAFITLLYVGETARDNTDDRTVLQKLFLGSDYISKELTIKPIFIGSVPEGYGLLKDEVKMSPESTLVIGPARFLADKKFLFTKPVSLNEHTKTKTLTVELESISRSIKPREMKVQLFLPIARMKKRKSRE
jgi:YbbR domain-containing protein